MPINFCEKMKKGACALLASVLLGYLPVAGQNTPGGRDEVPLTSTTTQKGKPDATIDFSTSKGRVKALHGVNGGPFNYGDQTSPLAFYHAEAGFPHTRLHDCNWPHPDVVDIPAIFPLFSADADDPKNYDFKKTDEYLLPIIKNKSEIIYRLGVSIEHKTQYHLYPPTDYKKWAKICLNIIRHYNEGWANGFHYNIKYWEIWNEPDNKRMWLGTPLQLFQLYETASKAIKAHDPSLKVGGPATIYVQSSFVKPFLAYCRDHGAPLDFFSWHIYTNNPWKMVEDAHLARQLLDEYGFQKTESHVNEWHYKRGPWNEIFPKSETDLKAYYTAGKALGETIGPEGAVFAAEVLMLLQDAPVDVGNYFSADYNPLSMFDPFGVPGKVYYVFKAFNQLAQMPTRVACDRLSADSSVVLAAGLSADQKSATFLISHNQPKEKDFSVGLQSLPASGKITAKIYQIDQTRNLELTGTRELTKENRVLPLTLSPTSVVLVTLNWD